MRRRFFNVFLAALALFIALYAGLYTAELKALFPFTLDFVLLSEGSLVWSPYLFWALALAFLALDYLRHARDDQDAETERKYQESVRNNLVHLQSALTSGVAEVNETLSSMPPQNFIKKLGDVYTATVALTDHAVTLAVAYGDEAPAKQAVVLLLDHICNLAALWDAPIRTQENNAIYSAHIMMFVACEQMSEADRTRIWDARRFVVERTATAAFASVDGFVELIPEFYRAGAANHRPMSPMALPVTLSDASHKRNQNLPGAPEALALGRTSLVTDTSEIVEQCRTRAGFDNATITAIGDYYAQDGKGRSIVSWPIRGDVSPFVGTINVFRDRVDMLRNEDRGREFATLVTPLIEMARRLLLVLPSYDSQACCSAWSNRFGIPTEQRPAHCEHIALSEELHRTRFTASESESRALLESMRTGAWRPNPTSVHVS